MSIEPLITFKAGLCDFNSDRNPPRIKARSTPGYIYLYQDEDLLHFCWRPRSAPLDAPEVDLIMFPTDGTFKPYQPNSAETPVSGKKATNGRIYVLKFSSSSQRHLFWLQSQSQHPTNDPTWFSSRDLKLGEIVDALLQGDEVDVEQEFAQLPKEESGGDNDDDETMEDVEGISHGSEHDRRGSGGAGPDATGGDYRDEGEPSREGGADGGRAASGTAEMDADTIIQNFIQSMGGAPGQQSGLRDKPFTTLADLLTPASTIPWIDSADEETVDRLLQYLPTTLVALAQQTADSGSLDFGQATAEAAKEALSTTQKKDILRRVLRSPQFSQSNASLTFALRDGGLPTISEALNIPVRNGGYMRRGGVPLGGGEAVEVFLQGVKDAVEKTDEEADSHMDTR